MTEWIRMPVKTYELVVEQARARQANNIAHGRKNAQNLGPRDNERDLEFDIMGRAAEVVIAHKLGIEWKSDQQLGPEYSGDVGNDEVRSTTHENGCLLLHPKDPDERVCWLVIARMPYEYKIAGWILISEGKQEEYWMEKVRGRGCSFFVPQSALFSLEDYVPF